MFPTTADLASACYNLYETADGEWLALGALEPKFWAGFCERIERPDLTPLQHAQGEEGARVLREVRTVMKTRTRDEWLGIFRGRRCLLDAGSGEGGSELARSDAGRPRPTLGADTDQFWKDSAVSTGDRRCPRFAAAGVI